MSVLITGGAGFMGSWLADYCLADGHEVLVVDNLSYGKRENVPPGAEFKWLDLMDADGISSVVSDLSPHNVVHFAAQKNVRYSAEHPRFDAKWNIIATLNLLEALKKHRRKHSSFKPMLIFASSACLLAPALLPLEKQSVREFASPYAISKFACEQYIKFYAELYDWPWFIFRFCNVYGPRQDPAGESGAVLIFAEAMLNNEPIRVFGKGLQKRDYVYVEDAIMLPRQIITYGSRGIDSGVYNVATGKLTSVNELIALLREQAGQGGKPKYLPRRPGDPDVISADYSKAKKAFKYIPKISLETGLRFTLAYLRSRGGRA